MHSVCLVGLGYWGKVLARNLDNHPKFQISAIVDSNPDMETFSKKIFATTYYSDLEDAISKHSFDVIFIATRPNSHLKLATVALSKCRILVISKPGCSTLQESQMLAEKSHLTETRVLVDYTYHYSPLYRKTKVLFEEIYKNDTVSIVSYRTALGIIQSDVNVIEDLICHDIAFLLTLLGDSVRKVHSRELDVLGFNKPTSALSTITWDSGTTLTSHTSWTTPRKMRTISIASKSRGLVLNDLDDSKTIEILEFDTKNLHPNGTSPSLKSNVAFELTKSYFSEVETSESVFEELNEIDLLLSGSPNAEVYTLERSLSVWKVLTALNESQSTSLEIEIDSI